MHVAPRQKHRSRWALLLVAAVLSVAVWASEPRNAEAGRAPQDVLRLEMNGFRYEYHLVTGREALFREDSGRAGFVDVLRGNETQAAACRRALAAQLGVEELSTLCRPDEDRDAIARLRALGYL